MKKILLSIAVAITATTGAFAQAAVSDVQNATLGTQVNRLIALRPYSATLPANNQSLSVTIADGNSIFTQNNLFPYAGNAGYNKLAYRIYSNYSYRATLSATATGSTDELNNYINFWAETLPSPQNGQAPWTSNNNGDHIVDVTTPTRLYTATGTPVQLIHNDAYSTGMYIPGGGPYSPLDPVNTDFAAFAVDFSCSPGFAVFPGTYTTNLTITATNP